MKREAARSSAERRCHICNIQDLGVYGKGLMRIEDRRIELHEAMCKDYGLRYEYTRTAVASVNLEIGKDTPERVAQHIDHNLRYLKGMTPAARTDENLDGFEKSVDELFSGRQK